jgi:hypothetical protein
MTMTRKTMIVISILLAAGCNAGSQPGSDVDAGDQMQADAAPRNQMPDAQMPDATRPMPDGGCDPTAADPIDSNGTDTNCDGFDGIAAQEIFVSPAGDDRNPGTPGFPVATLAKAVQIAAGKPIIVGIGDYHEDLSVTGGAPKLHGGYDQSAGWVRISDPHRRSNILTSRIGVNLRDLTGDAELDRVDITPDLNAQILYEDSFALRASGDVQLTIRDSNIISGDAIGQPFDEVPGASGGSGVAGLAGSYTGSVGAGGSSPCSTPGGVGGGGNGAVGLSGVSGNDGAAGYGLLTLDTYQFFPGGNGTDGTDGSSAAGGANSGGGPVSACPAGVRLIDNFEAPGSGGGGGGGAGCAGRGASGGTSGAGSFAIIVSHVRLDLEGTTTIVSGAGIRGGAGGNGGNGGVGGRGGAGGSAICGRTSEIINNRPVYSFTYAPAAQAGGFAGGGGRGGHGGGGAGGHSIGVAKLAGATVTVGNGVTITPGAAGAGGPSLGHPGPDGIAAAVQQF